MVRIVSDSTCDLSPELVARYGVIILPLYIRLGEKEYEDGRNITPDEIYRWADENRTTPKTAAVSRVAAEKLFASILEDGDEAVCFSISGQMSATGNVMRLAAEELQAAERIRVIDSCNLSTGVGLQVIAAAEMAQKGCSAADIEQAMKDLTPRVQASFVVDTLTYLHRGGRCSGVAALMGSALKLHPKILVQDGKMQPDKKYRGRMRHVVMNYVRDLEPELLQADTARVFITHSGCENELIGAVREYLESLGRFEEIHITRAGGVISSHCGPGTLGVLFIAGQKT